MNASASAIEQLLSKSRPDARPFLPKELRRAKRYRMDVPARIRIYVPSRPERRSPEISAQVVDLSTMGIGLLADSVEGGGLHIMHPWPATSEQCRLEVQILHGAAPLTLQGKAVWYCQLEDKKRFGFRMGIELTDLTVELQERIRELIAQKAGGAGSSPPEPK